MKILRHLKDNKYEYRKTKDKLPSHFMALAFIQELPVRSVNFAPFNLKCPVAKIVAPVNHLLTYIQTQSVRHKKSCLYYNLAVTTIKIGSFDGRLLYIPIGPVQHSETMKIVVFNFR